MVGAAASALLGSGACVVVPSPSLETETETAEIETETASTGDPEAAETIDPDPLEPSPFPLYWAVHSEPVEAPGELTASVDVRTPVHLFPDLGLGQTPASVDDPAALVAAIVERVEAAVPDDGAPGLGLLANPNWEVPWCRASDEDRAAFAASDLGAGLSEDELGPAWEAAATSLLLDLVERCRAARPGLEWTISSLPRQEYWQLVRDEPADIQQWRDCAVLDPSAVQIWDAVDLLAPELPFFYPTDGDPDVREQNTRYLERFIESARLSGKRVVPVVEGRYRRSSDTDTNPIMWLPLLAEDFDLTLESVRRAGGQGIVYWFDSERCWNYEAGCDAADPGDATALFLQYVQDVVQPAFEAVDEP